ncbi:hypothetical protein [Pseudonocardia sp. GCM10023141]|uniref:hypothetical protein n=1 Tax=Pseudonocardia sp. GCM10023141 TaxID=3252653 RepID=UPI003608271D
MTCPVAAGFDPLDAGYLADPFPVLAGWREQTPVFHAPSIERWVVTRYADIDRILTDPHTFSAVEAQRPV